jgi:hypothetical protein
MYQDGTFDLSCQGIAPWNGVGHWRKEGAYLSLKFETLGEKESRMAQPPTLKFRLDGHGNVIDLQQEPGGLKFRWERRLTSNPPPAPGPEN